jgi:dTDP-4-amino-4,6-dideoxygalactose transaminase
VTKRTIRPATPLAGEQIGVGGVTISPKQKRYVLDALDHNRLSYGPYTQRFEAAFAAAHERAFAMFCNSGTSALQVGLHALKRHHRWADGDEVIVPAVTFVASSNVVIQNRLTPVFVDVDPVYYELDPAKLEAAITAKTRAIMPVHLFGQPCDMRAIMSIAKQHQLTVIEDSCETMFVRAQGKVTGSWGAVSCFSTYVAHLLVTGVGGFATTDDRELAVRMKSLMNHGRDGVYLKIDDDRGKTGSALFDLVARRFRFTDVGYSYRATELESALGLAQLEDAAPLLVRRQAIAAQLTAGLADLTDQLQLPTVRPESEHAFMMYPLVVTVGSRDALVNYLESRPRPIETRPMLPLINQPIYQELFGNLNATFPEAHRINEQGFYIGSHPEMTDADVSYIVETFHDYFKKASLA